MDNINGLISFIGKSKTAYHAVDAVKSELLSAGFLPLPDAPLEDGRGYFAEKNGSSIIAFRYQKNARGFMICASHSDSPAFKLKLNEKKSGAYTTLATEKYGGMLYYSWFDRPLSVAGRVIIDGDRGLEIRLVDIDRDLLVIPSLAIHMNRGVNDGFAPNPASDLLPLLSVGEASITELIAEKLGVPRSAVIDHDLFLYNREEGRAIGKDGEFILAPRLDDLACVYSSLTAFLSAEPNAASVPVLAVFDNEEVGSATKQGADSAFMQSILSRLSGEKYSKMIKSSFMISADNAHAIHPNRPEMADPTNAPVLNSGVVIKYNANQRYATDGLSAAIFKKLAAISGVKLQSYANRADLPGGSTLGSIASTGVPVSTVDVGIAQLAMHSASELIGARDLSDMIAVMRAHYSSALEFTDGAVKLI